MSRRFLNLIVQDLNTRVKSLYLIDPSKHLFYPPTAEREAAAHADLDKEKRVESIDPLRFHKPHFRFGSGHPVKPPMHFFSALLNHNCLLLADSSETPFLYSIDLKSELRIADMDFPKGPNCVSFSTPNPDPYHLLSTHCLYVLDLSPATTNSIGSNFEVLHYFSNDYTSQPHLKHCYENSFYWRTLPQPPLVVGDMCSSMLVGGSTICISSIEKGVGTTYTFDMLANVWTQAGDWVLPFCGKAEYVPHLNLYFALSADSPHRLCALDIATAGPPTLVHTFDYLDLPEKWSTYKCHLVNLGSASFCIISFCEHRNRKFVVFTGVEVKPCNSGDGPLRLIKHLSKRYSLGSHSIMSVL